MMATWTLDTDVKLLILHHSIFVALHCVYHVVVLSVSHWSFSLHELYAISLHLKDSISSLLWFHVGTISQKISFRLSHNSMFICWCISNAYITWSLLLYTRFAMLWCSPVYATLIIFPPWAPKDSVIFRRFDIKFVWFEVGITSTKVSFRLLRFSARMTLCFNFFSIEVKIER